MVYKFFYKAKAEPERNFDITYAVAKEGNAYYLESFINGSGKKESSFLGNCKEEKATEIAKLLAEKAVRPLHIDDIISDFRF